MTIKHKIKYKITTRARNMMGNELPGKIMVSELGFFDEIIRILYNKIFIFE